MIKFHVMKSIPKARLKRYVGRLPKSHTVGASNNFLSSDIIETCVYLATYDLV